MEPILPFILLPSPTTSNGTLANTGYLVINFTTPELPILPGEPAVVLSYHRVPYREFQTVLTYRPPTPGLPGTLRPWEPRAVLTAPGPPPPPFGAHLLSDPIPFVTPVETSPIRRPPFPTRSDPIASRRRILIPRSPPPATVTSGTSGETATPSSPSLNTPPDPENGDVPSSSFEYYSCPRN